MVYFLEIEEGYFYDPLRFFIHSFMNQIKNELNQDHTSSFLVVGFFNIGSMLANQVKNGPNQDHTSCGHTKPIRAQFSSSLVFLVVRFFFNIDSTLSRVDISSRLTRITRVVSPQSQSGPNSPLFLSSPVLLQYWFDIVFFWSYFPDPII